VTNGLTELGREAFLDKAIDWNTDTISAALLDLNTAETGVIQITSSTSATPPVLLTSTHGLTSGDIVFIQGHTTNLACNGLWKVTVTDGTHFSLQTLAGANVVGTGGAGASGYALVFGGASTVGKFYADYDGCQVGGGAGKVNLTSPTLVNGVADAADTTFALITGATVEALGIFLDTGSAATSRMIGFVTGFHQVKCAQTATSTTIRVDPLVGGIASGVTLKWSSGETSTLTAPAVAGDRTITVTSTTVTVEATVSAPANGSGLPVNPNGGNIIVAWDNGANKIFKL
jgi:hypothetical protein